MLVNEGHADSIQDLQHHDYINSTRLTGDFLIYRCKDRVALFSRDGDGKVASVADQTWWSNNGCTTYPIDRLGAVHFKVSRSLSEVADEGRAQAMSNVISALESYAASNGTYKVTGGGWGGNGQGWFHYDSNSKYTQGVGNVLVNEGHADSIEDLEDPIFLDSARVAGDFLIYRCKDRVAIFSRHGGSAETSTTDQAWWSNNGCTTYPIDRLNATYFQVSQPRP